MGHPLGMKGQVLCGSITALTILLAWIQGVMN
jgi:hypothetical protein